jgi:hypothetical protein
VRLEHVPLLVGVLFALLGLGLLVDSRLQDYTLIARERRRRPRAERHRVGEALVGLGALCVAASLFGRDTWRWGNVAVLAGTLLVVFGALLNRPYLRELFSFRGPARRAAPGERIPGVPLPTPRPGPTAPQPDARPATQSAAPGAAQGAAQSGPQGGPQSPAPARPPQPMSGQPPAAGPQPPPSPRESDRLRIR